MRKLWSLCFLNGSRRPATAIGLKPSFVEHVLPALATPLSLLPAVCQAQNLHCYHLSPLHFGICSFKHRPHDGCGGGVLDEHVLPFTGVRNAQPFGLRWSWQRCLTGVPKGLMPKCSRLTWQRCVSPEDNLQRCRNVPVEKYVARSWPLLFLVRFSRTKPNNAILL